MIKPKGKRKGDFAQIAHSVVADAIKATEKPIKAPSGAKKKRSKS